MKDERSTVVLFIRMLAILPTNSLLSPTEIASLSLRKQRIPEQRCTKLCFQEDNLFSCL